MAKSVDSKRCYRVVLASPSDVKAERDIVPKVIAEINQTLDAAGRRALLELSRCEDVYPGLHRDGPQGRVDEDLSVEDCDILVGVFWKRFGSPVADAALGTEHEIRKALKAWQAKGTPQVMLYFCETPYTPTSSDEVQQIGQVIAFREEMLPLGLLRFYRSPEEFGEILRADLVRYSFKVLTATEDSRIPAGSAFHVHVLATASSVRAEGLAELLGEISVVPQGPRVGPEDLPESANVRVFTNVNLTNRLLTGNLTDAFLVSRTVAGQSSVHLGRMAADNCITFENVPLRESPENALRAFQIMNLRGNANQMGFEGTSGSILAYVQIDGVKVRDPEQTIARIGPGLQFETLNADDVVVQSEEDATRVLQSSGRWRRVATLRFSEGMPAAFRCRALNTRDVQATFVNYMSFESAILGLPVCSELGKTSLAGLADCGTQLVAEFHCVPVSLRLFVSAKEVAAKSGLGAATILGVREPAKQSSRANFPLDSVPVVEVQLAGSGLSREGIVVWEVVGRSSSVRGQLEFEVYAEHDPHPDENRPCLGTAFVSCFLGPSSMVTRASGCDPVPRFANLSRMQCLLRVVR